MASPVQCLVDHQDILSPPPPADVSIPPHSRILSSHSTLGPQISVFPLRNRAGASPSDRPDILSPLLQAATKSPSQAVIRCRPDESASPSGGLCLSLTGPLLHTAASDLSSTGLFLRSVSSVSTARLRPFACFQSFLTSLMVRQQ